MANIKFMGKNRNGKNAYKFTVSLGYDDEGKQIRKYKTYIATTSDTSPVKLEREVHTAFMKYEEDCRKQLDNPKFEGDIINFNSFIEDWKKNWAGSHLTQAVIEGYLGHLNKHVCPSIGKKYLSNITVRDCQKIIDNMIHDGYAPKTVRRVFTALESVMKYAYRIEVIRDNPCNRCELPRIEIDTELHYFDQEQANRFIYEVLPMQYEVVIKEHESKQATKKNNVVYEYTTKHSIPLQFQVFFKLAMFGGFRKGELIALTWNDINFEERSISITKSIAKTKGGQIVKGTKTKAGIREVTLIPECFDDLRQLYKEQVELSEKLGTAWQGFREPYFDDNNIFIQADGKRMDVDTPYHKFKAIIEMYNKTVSDDKKLPVIRLHDLRHTYATLLLAENTNIESVSELLGHAKPSITLDVYGHALKKKNLEASMKLAELFKRPTETATEETRSEMMN